MKLERWFFCEAFVTQLAFVQMLTDRSNPMIAVFSVWTQRIKLVLHWSRMRVHRRLDLDQPVGRNHGGQAAVRVEIFVALLITHVSEQILIFEINDDCCRSDIYRWNCLRIFHFEGCIRVGVLSSIGRSCTHGCVPVICYRRILHGRDVVHHLREKLKDRLVEKH